MKNLITLFIFMMILVKAEAQSSVFAIVENSLNKGDYLTAIAALEDIDSKSEKEYAKLGSIYHTVGNYTKAIENFESSLEIATDNSIRFKLGQAYNAAGLSNNALLTFEKVLEADSTYLLAASSLGKLYVSRNRLNDAAEIYSYLKVRDSLNPEFPYKLGQVREKQKRIFEMGNNYLESYEIDSLHLKSIYGLAKFYKKLKFKDSTALFLNKGLEIDSLNTQFLQFKSNELYYAKDFEACLIYLNKLDSLNYKTINSLEMKGMCYYNLKDYDAAEKVFRQALKIERNSQIFYRLASLKYDQKDYEWAEYYLNMSISTGLGDLDKQYYLKGVMAKENGELKIALKYFKESFRYNSKNYKAKFEVASISDVYYDDSKIALREYDQFLKRFESRDSDMTSYAENRIKEIKRELFLQGETIEN